MSKVVIEVNDNNYCKVIYENDNGAKSIKRLPYDTVVNLMVTSSLEQEIQEEHEMNVSEIFPGDSIISTIQTKEIASQSSKWFILLREQVPVDIILGPKKYKQVAMPKTIYAVKVCNDRCVSLKICCIKDSPIIDNNTTIYRYPYSNVFDTRNVCLGSNILNDFDLNGTRNICMIPEMFLAMKNNHDGYSGSNKSSMNYEDLLEVFEGAKFDENILVESYSTKTYGDFVASLK